MDIDETFRVVRLTIWLKKYNQEKKIEDAQFLGTLPAVRIPAGTSIYVKDL